MAPPKGHPPYNKNGEGGRPKKWDGKSLEALANSLDKWIDEAVATKKEFWWWDWCWEVGLNQNKVSEMARKNDRFKESYENAKAWQESIVARFALTKKFSEGFSKFMLTNHYADKWKDKNDTLSAIPPQDIIIDKENEIMSLKAQVEQLKAKIDHQS